MEVLQQEGVQGATPDCFKNKKTREISK